MGVLSDGLQSSEAKPFWQIVFVGATHCGAGCTLGDICSEFILFFTGFVFAGDMFQSSFVMDYIFAYVFGIAFQYYTIAPVSGMRGVHQRIWRAMKGDTLSLTAFEIELFGWMAISHFFIFHPNVLPNSPTYWFLMQIGMCIGFATSYPMSWWLIKTGIKGAM